MIKVGILEASSAVGSSLVRILLNHPDVEIAWAHSSVAQGPLSSAIRGISGETDMTFSRHDLLAVDAIINCSSASVDSDFLAAIACDPAKVRIIELCADVSDSFTYGLCELNRKTLVRGALTARSVSPLAMAVELALLPLAKNLMLNAPISVAAAVGVGATHSISRRGTGRMPEADEIADAMRVAQSSFYQPIDIVEMRCGDTGGLMAVVSTQCTMPVGELRPIYESCYSDHNFTFISNEPVDTRDVIGTNKCLIHIEKDGNLLRATSVLDPRVKGAAGNAVHILNLMFGLHERTGLNLISSCE